MVINDEMRRAAIAVTFVGVFGVLPEGEWEGRDGTIFDLIWYHEMPASSRKMLEGTAHALDCMLSHDAYRCSRQPALFNG